MKRSEVLLLQAGLASIPKEVLPFKIRYTVGRVLNQCHSVFREAERQQKALYRELGVPNADKTKVDIPPERWEEFQTRIEEFMEADAGVEFFTVKMSELAQCDGLEAVHLGALEPIVVDDVAGASPTDHHPV
jgi:hypothetical protein